MGSTFLAHVMPAAIGAWTVAAAIMASASILDLNPIQDDLTDDVISPWCRIGSLDSWQGRPCVVPETALPR